MPQLEENVIHGNVVWGLESKKALVPSWDSLVSLCLICKMGVT